MASTFAVLRPVPTAVPPRARRYNAGNVASTRSIPYSTLVSTHVCPAMLNVKRRGWREIKHVKRGMIAPGGPIDAEGPMVGGRDERPSRSTNPTPLRLCACAVSDYLATTTNASKPLPPKAKPSWIEQGVHVRPRSEASGFLRAWSSKSVVQQRKRSHGSAAENERRQGTAESTPPPETK